MRYEKPVVMDLSAAARAAGLDPLGCYNGSSPAGRPWCQAGTSASVFGGKCEVGPGPGTFDPASCFPGGSATWVCVIGGAPTGPSDTCSTGTVPS